MPFSFVAAFLLYFLLPVTANAQGCPDGLVLQPGQVLEYHTFKAKSKKPHYIARHSVMKLEQADNRVLAHLKCGFYGPDNKLIRSFNYYIGCENYQLILDKEILSDPDNLVLFEDKTFTFDGENIVYPANAQPGQTLANGLHTVQVTTGSVKMANVSTALVNRQVEAIEQIITPAGTFTAYKISYRKELMRGSKEMSITQRKCLVEYVVPGFGPVRSEQLNKRGKLVSYTVLASYQK